MSRQKIAYVSVMLLVVKLCAGGTGTGTKVQSNLVRILKKCTLSISKPREADIFLP